jgi:uncharacterized coiled-coil DUF342 family protein/peptidoglycan hydrolase-like protein with peptidoglycan-binding domain
MKKINLIYFKNMLKLILSMLILLCCNVQSTSASDLVVNFEKLKISHYDASGTPYIGIYITFSNPSINGRVLKSKFTFDLDARRDTRTTHAIGLRNTFSKFLDRSVADREQPGNFYITAENASELRQLYNFLGENDRLLLKAACGKAQEKEFVKSVIDYVNNESLSDNQKQLKSIFSSNRNLNDINRIARNCLRSLPGPKVTFMQKRDDRSDGQVLVLNDQPKLNCAATMAKNCSAKDLCKFGTQPKDGKIVWVKNEWLKGYVSEAKKRRLSCNVGKNASFDFSKQSVTVNAPPKSICGFSIDGLKLDRNQLKNIQKRLRFRGLYKGAIDGVMGKGSCAGLKQFMSVEVTSKTFNDIAYGRLANDPTSSAKAKYTERTTQSTPNSGKFPLSESRYCRDNRAVIRANQSVLKDLGFYKSVLDGLSGPNYNRAVIKAEKLLGDRADKSINCINQQERQALVSVYTAKKIGSICLRLLNPNEIDILFQDLKGANLTKKLGIKSETVGGLIWSIDTAAELEAELDKLGYYESTGSKRDCILDRNEVDALAPKRPVIVSLGATTLSMATLETGSGPTLRLTAGGSDLETSKMSKSVFGGSNQASMDIQFKTFKGNPVLDLIISEEDTKIDLHLFGSGLANQTVAVSIPELLLDEKTSGRSSFSIRMYNDGSTNIANGDFEKLVTKMPEKDKAIVSSLCGQIGKVASSNEGFAASFAATADRDAFRRSTFSSEPVREAIASLANQCVDEIRTKGLVNASFDVEAPMPVCSAAQNELLSKLDIEIDEAQTLLQGYEDEIKTIQVNRPLFERNACLKYETDLGAAQGKLNAVESEIMTASTSLTDLETKLDEAEDIKGRLSKISQPSELCDVENKALKEKINGFIQSLNPAGVGVICPGDKSKNPIQIVIDEINAEITKLLEIHISPDQIDELKNTISQLEAERVELAANLADMSQTKASPVEIDQQVQTNAGLSDTVSQIEDQVSELETEISDLRFVMDNNASLIAEIDQLNQELVTLTSQKMLTQGTLEDMQSKVLESRGSVEQLEMQIDKVKSQTADLEVQIGASSSTAGNLQQEVKTLTLDVSQTQKRIEKLEEEVAVAQDLIDNANSVITSSSQAVAKLDTELNSKNATATTLKVSVDTLGPQSDAAEQTVRDLEASLKSDFVPGAEYKEQESRLNEMTQIVTERTKLIRELRDDLQAIQGEEQLLVKMCLADAQCKSAMGDRLGVE